MDFYISVIMLSGCQASVTENAAVIDDKDENVIQVCETETKTQTENEYENIPYEAHKIWVYRESAVMQDLTADLYFPDDVTAIPALQLINSDDTEKADRINRMMIERAFNVLPMEQDWLDTTEIQITYCSERYLCFEYLSKAHVSNEFDFTKLNFTLDLEQEQWVEYPLKAAPYFFFEDTYLYKEMENYMEMSVEEQSSLRGKTTYELYEQQMKEENFTFSVVQVRGMPDEIKQEQINKILREPMLTLVEDDGWTKEDKRKEILGGASIYIAYKTEEWLSMLYIIPHGTRRYEFQRADLEMGVTVNMKTGERYMLDDLFELRGLNKWMSVNDFHCIDDSGGCVLGERRLAENRKKDEFYEGDNIITRLTFPSDAWISFYLYAGRVVFVGCDYDDYTIELPDIYEYLKVDPWY